ncbi:MAG: hypothetical protein AAGF11_10690 [Myxococcota bacterium]
MTEDTSRTLTGLGEVSNPFVGPRPIQQGEELHGRGVEVDELYDRLQARRIVVLHSPSGAGKSSLVQAGLVPKLKAARYDVWKPIRVNLDPDGLPGVPEGTNRYLLSAMVSLEEELPQAKRRSPAELARMDLLEYLDTRPRRKGMKGRSVALLFDQFEEVLTAAPRAVEAKRAFFTAVGQALDTDKYWALFIIREDYLAALAPYRDLVPTQLANSFRLDLLGLDGAREAAEQLVLSGGRSFPAVDQLVHDLSRVHVLQPNGSFTVEQGMYVEPVQLQVVCRRLWEALPEDAPSIEADDIEQYADVSRSLAGYYSDAVKGLARGDTGLERKIRDWVGQELIVGGHRSQVRQDAGTLAELGEELVGRLLDTYLVRTEQRAGASWFELSHDRLVEPVLEDNEAWEQAHLHPLQVQAKLWDDGGRVRALLLGADALPDASRWAENHPELLTKAEREFLTLSRTLRQEQARQRRRQRIFTVTVAVVAVVAMVLGGVAWVAQRRADARRREAVAAKEEALEATQEAEQARQQAERAKSDAQDAQSDAEQARGRAEKAKEAAERAEKKTERLARDALRQMFEVGLRPFVQNLAKEGLETGEIEIDEQWTSLLAWKGQDFAAANLLEGGGRIVAAGHDAVLREVAEGEKSLFLEITTKWLLGDQGVRGIAVITQHAKRDERFEALRRNLSVLGYEEVDAEPPLARLADDEEMGIVVVDNRWEALTAEEISGIEAFVDRGGGLLVVGGGREWLDRKVERGEAAPSLENYPMNRLMREFGVIWNDQTIDPEELERQEEQASLRFENTAGHAVDVLLRSYEGYNEYYMTLDPGEAQSASSAIGRTWVIEGMESKREIGTVTIKSRKEQITIGQTVTSKAVVSRPKAEPKSNTPIKPAPLPKTISDAELASAKAAMSTVSRDCSVKEGAMAKTVDVRFEISPKGKVVSAVAQGRYKGSLLGSCVTDVLKRRRFSKSQQGVKDEIWTLPLR